MPCMDEGRADGGKPHEGCSNLTNYTAEVGISAAGCHVTRAGLRPAGAYLQHRQAAHEQGVVGGDLELELVHGAPCRGGGVGGWGWGQAAAATRHTSCRDGADAPPHTVMTAPQLPKPLANTLPLPTLLQPTLHGPVPGGPRTQLARQVPEAQVADAALERLGKHARQRRHHRLPLLALQHGRCAVWWMQQAVMRPKGGRTLQT